MRMYITAYRLRFSASTPGMRGCSAPAIAQTLGGDAQTGPRSKPASREAVCKRNIKQDNTMKKMMLRTVLVVAAAIAGPSVHAAVTVSPGNPLSVPFSDLPAQGYFGYPNQFGISFYMSDSDQFDAGDIMRLEAFNDPAFSDPVSFGAIGNFIYFDDSTGDGFGVGGVPLQNGNRGGFRLTALAGSISVESVYVQVFISGEKYGEAFTLPLAPVPEPETFALTLAGLAAVGATARRRKAANPTARLPGRHAGE